MSTSFWHGFADMHVVKDAEHVIREGDGAWVTDVAGNRYLDATAGLWYANAGFGRVEIADAVAAQLRKLSAYSSFGAYTTEPTVELAARIAAMAPMDDAVVFFTSGGSEAVDTAAKLARRYWDVLGRPEKQVMVSREHSYHGMAAFGTSLAGIPSNKAGYGPLVGDIVVVGTHDLEGLAALFEARGGEIAAFYAEPVVGAGGVYPPIDGYFDEVQALCRRHEILLIADEIVTGFGRTGQWWGSTRYGIEPDMITFAKGITSGLRPAGRRDRRAAGPCAVLGRPHPGRCLPPRLHVLRACDGVCRGHGQPRPDGARRPRRPRAEPRAGPRARDGPAAQVPARVRGPDRRADRRGRAVRRGARHRSGHRGQGRSARPGATAC